MVSSLSHGLGGLLLKVAVEELVVQQHAGDICYVGVVDPVRGAIKGLYPAVREHQRELSAEGLGTKYGVVDPIPEGLDLITLERVVAEASIFRDAHPL